MSLVKSNHVKRAKADARPADQIFYLILVAHFYFEYVRPASVFPFLSPLKMGGILLFASILIWVFRCSKDALKDSMIKLYCLGLIQMLIWVPLARNNYYAFTNTSNLVYFLVGAILPLAALLNSGERVRHFFHHWTVINFIVALVTIREGGKGTGGFLADENDVGLAMNMALPYAVYLSFDSDITKRRRIFYWLCILVILFAIVYSRSRGALVGFAAVLLVMWLLSEKRIKHLSIGLLTTVLFGGIIVAMLPEGYSERMMTASDPNNSTRVERIYSWSIGWVMFRENPIFGVGPGNFPYHVIDYQDEVVRPKGRPPIAGRVAHSLYFTLLPELGLFGCMIFAFLVGSVVSRMRKIYKSKHARDSDGQLNNYGLIAKANVVSLAAYLSAGAFITVNYYPNFWFLIGFSVALYRQFFKSFPDALLKNGRAIKSR